MKAEYAVKRTSKTGVETDAGWITHLPIVSNDGVIDAPVKVIMRKTIGRNGLRTAVDPVEHGGRRVYALPGGGSYVA